MSPPIASGQSESGKARFAGSASSGILELIIFHPVDTVAKRLMSNQNKVLKIQGQVGEDNETNSTCFHLALDFRPCVC